MYRTSRIIGRLRLAVRIGLMAALDTSISNISPSTPIRGGTAPHCILRANQSITG
jgi:hypothetical protein